MTEIQPTTRWSAPAIVLGGAPGLRLVGEAVDGDEVPAAVPAVVLVDIRMTRTDGLAATERRLAGRAGPQVIVLTSFDAGDHVLRALRAAASGFLLEDTPPAAIVDALRRVADGEPMLSPTVTRRLMAHVAGAAAPRDDSGSTRWRWRRAEACPTPTSRASSTRAWRPSRRTCPGS